MHCTLFTLSLLYILQIRNVFSKLVTFLCWLTNKDPPFEVEVTTNAGIGTLQRIPLYIYIIIYMYLNMCIKAHGALFVCVCVRVCVCVCVLVIAEKSQTLFSEIALNSLLQLLKKEVSVHSRHLHQYFQVFLSYANRGPYEVSVSSAHIL